ncbi:TetR/AcrR family transcriptional regulator [Actinomycetes bacterium KLBMP 9759]
MRKGEATRSAILDEASRLASQVGLGGLTIGSLATQTELSKSGLFAHFGSKESLQLEVIEHTSERFTAAVIRPALKEARGEPRLRKLFELWLEWGSVEFGCPFISAAFELDDQPGPLRDRMVRNQRDWVDTIAMVFSGGVTEGHFRADADPYQFAFDVEGVMLAFTIASRLLGDPDAAARATGSFERLLAAAAA